MQDTPDVDVIVMFEVKDQVGVALEWPYAQTRQIQFMGIAWRTGRRMATEMRVGLFECVDEAERRLFTAFIQVVRHGFLNIQVCPLTRDDRFDAQVEARRRMRSRKASK